MWLMLLRDPNVTIRDVGRKVEKESLLFGGAVCFYVPVNP